MTKRIHIVGFGSQGRAWARCLAHHGWEVEIFLPRDSSSFQKASSLSFQPKPIADLAPFLKSSSSLVALLCPDSQIAQIYQEYLSKVQNPLTLILAHGYVMYAGELKPRPGHEVALLAPKAIGPKLESATLSLAPGTSHDLVAAFFSPPSCREILLSLGRDLGFHPSRLVPASFEEEAIGDLMSEQGLLCGSVFTFLEWTLQAMSDARVPLPLIREECLRELELIAGLLRERGPATTFRTISQAAQCGTVAMREKLMDSGAKEQFLEQMNQVLNKKFVGYFREGAWKKAAHDLSSRLDAWETKMKEGSSP